MIKRSKKAIANDRMIKDLDNDCRLRVFERDNYTCQRCKETAWLQWSHVHSRRHHCIRWDADNSKVLCRKCHTWWEHNKGQGYYWFAQNWPTRWERINEILRKNPKVRVKELWSELRTQ